MWNSFLLKSLDKAIDSPGPGDKIVLLREATNSTSSHTVNLFNIVKPSAVVYYWQFKQAQLSAGAVLTSAAAVAGASGAVMDMVIVNAEDLSPFMGE